MATTTTPGVRLSALPPAAGRAGLKGALASEYTKIRSVRSTYWTLGALFVVSVGLGVAIAAGTSANWQQPPVPEGRVRRHPDLARRVLRDRPADHRGAWRDGDHLGVLDRDDPHLADRPAPARRRLRRQGDRVHVGDARDLAHHGVHLVLRGSGGVRVHRGGRLPVPRRQNPGPTRRWTASSGSRSAHRSSGAPTATWWSLAGTRSTRRPCWPRSSAPRCSSPWSRSSPTASARWSGTRRARSRS